MQIEIKDGFAHYPCGCKFEVLETSPVVRLRFDPHMENLPLDCSRTWALLGEGNTKGVFQLESRFGQQYSKKLKPENIEQLAALTAILRPGCLAAIRDGKSVTDHYIDRKNGVEEITYVHPALEQILKDTYGEMCIHEDTFISMSDGSEKRIKNIHVNDQVQSLDESSLLIRHKDLCERIVATRKEKGIKLRLENGFTVTTTKDHKIFTNDGWIEAQNLDPQQHIIATANKQYNSPQKNVLFNSEFVNSEINTSYLIGQLVGDGCSGSCIASGTDDNNTKLLRWLKNNTSLHVNHYKHGKCNYIAIHHPSTLDSCLRKKLKLGNRKTKYRFWIESLGLDKTKENKEIPDCIFCTSDKNRRAFLAGLLDSDGYIGKSSSGDACIIHYCSNNEQTINGIRKLLAIDGISTYITPDYKHIYVKNTKKFVNLVGQYLILKTWRKNGYLLPDTNHGSIASKLVKDKIKTFSSSIRKYFEYPRVFGRRTLDQPHGFCGQWIGESVGIDFGDVKWMRIASIKETNGEEQFYSISIKKNHNVIANGIIIKNCYQEQAMKIAQDIAGFDLQKADILRKAIGKKKADIMAKVKVDFIEGCRKTGIVDNETAENLFGWIEKSQRYSFNKCLDPSSIVQTENGYKLLDEIVIGDKILAPKNEEYDEFVEVLDIIDCGEKEVYEIETESGETLICTIDHELLCSDGEKHRLSEIIEKNLEIMVYN